MEIAVLSGLAIGAYLLTAKYDQEQSQGDKNMAESTHMLNRDLLDAGINWGNQKVSDLNIVDLNNANAPYTAPMQTTTNDYSSVALDQAARSTYIKAFQPDFYFRNNIEIPIARAQASVYNIELPSVEGMRGDPDNKLGRFPRAYVDYHGKSPHQYTGDDGTMGAMGASEPEIWEEREVPPTGQLNMENNPYGPGGAYQDLMNRANEALVRARGVNQASIIGPPIYGESMGFIS